MYTKELYRSEKSQKWKLMGAFASVPHSLVKTLNENLRLGEDAWAPAAVVQASNSGQAQG